MANTKLTDAQRVILATAGSRDSGLVLPVANSLGNNRGTLGVILKSLITRGLIAERSIRPDEEVWRESDDLGRTTLVVSAEGLTAIGIDPVEHPAAEGKGTLIVGGGHAMPGIGQPSATWKVVDAGEPTSSLPKAGTKLDALIIALRQPTGATITDLTQATGWQSHSVRGAMSVNLKKKLKFDVASDVIEGRGRIAEASSK